MQLADAVGELSRRGDGMTIAELREEYTEAAVHELRAHHPGVEETEVLGEPGLSYEGGCGDVDAWLIRIEDQLEAVTLDPRVARNARDVGAEVEDGRLRAPSHEPAR